jgi:hypothetical protein
VTLLLRPWDERPDDGMQPRIPSSRRQTSAAD